MKALPIKADAAISIAQSFLCMSAFLSLMTQSHDSAAAAIEVVRLEKWHKTTPALTATDLKTPKCNIRLTGPIERGDAERLKSALSKRFEANASEFGIQRLPWAPFYLCLSSAGGDYSEALLFSAWLMSADGAGISTVVESGAKCYSACALIFLAGNREGHRRHWQSRWLHVNGQLGFHAPFLDENQLPNRAYSKDEALAFFRSAQLGAQRAIDAFSVLTYSRRPDQRRPWVKQSLFQQLLLQDPSKLLLIDTIDKAGRWEIQLFGYKPLPIPTDTMVQVACVNIQAWYTDRFAAEAGGVEALVRAEVRRSGPTQAKRQKVGNSVLEWGPSTHAGMEVEFSSYPYAKCTFGYDTALREIELSASLFGARGDGNSVWGSERMEWAFFPPNTKLIELAE